MAAPINRAAREPATSAALPMPHALRSVGAFVALCMILAVGGALATATMPATVPFVLALAPAAIAIGVASFEDRGAVIRLLRSLWTRPSHARWYLVVLLPVAWALATVTVGVVLGLGGANLFPDLLPSAVILPLVVLLPALAEELAWRGFAVPRLMTVMSPLRAALLLSVPWVVMHLALMVPGGMNAGAALWPTVLSLVAYSVVLTWVFVGSGGSVLLAGLVHAGFNGVVPLMRGIDPDASWAIRAVLAAAIAVAIVGLGGFSTRPGARSRRPSTT